MILDMFQNLKLVVIVVVLTSWIQCKRICEGGGGGIVGVTAFLTCNTPKGTLHTIMEATTNHKDRRQYLQQSFICFFMGTIPPPVAVVGAAETVGKDPNCNDSTCLGVWDGLLADCPHTTTSFMKGGAGCVSSQDDTPGIFAEP